MISVNTTWTRLSIGLVLGGLLMGCLTDDDDADFGGDPAGDLVVQDGKSDDLTATLGISLVRPADLVTEPRDRSGKPIWFLQLDSGKLDTVGTGTARHLARPFTEAEGRELYFNGILPRLANKTAFKGAAMHTQRRLRADGTEYYVQFPVDPPCAYSVSSAAEQMAEDVVVKKQMAGEDAAAYMGMVEKFENHLAQAATHNVEIPLRDLGFVFYRKADFVAPRGAIGTWSRYTFHGWKQHTGHIYWVLADRGLDGNLDRIADNNGRFDFQYTPEGTMDGFWLPPGIYPHRRTP